nr:hypothetical protein [uncultured Anaerosporobacter sp.]
MSFIKDIPDYKNYKSDDFYTISIPDTPDMWKELQAYASRAEELGVVVNQLNKLVLLPFTTNRGGWAINDLDNAFSTLKRKVREGKIHLFFDAVVIIIEESSLDLEEINDFLLQYKIGYEVYRGFDSYEWCIRDNISKLSENIDNTLKVLEKTPFEQAFENLQQAKVHFQNLSNERALKDAVRDCASAMESIIKILGKNDDIKKASKNLRDTKLWGLDDIVKDGDAIFSRLHYLYPDFRHGSTGMSSMTINEAKYWADRMICFIDYILRQKEELV